MLSLQEGRSWRKRGGRLGSTRGATVPAGIVYAGAVVAARVSPNFVRKPETIICFCLNLSQ